MSSLSLLLGSNPQRGPTAFWGPSIKGPNQRPTSACKVAASGLALLTGSQDSQRACRHQAFDLGHLFHSTLAEAKLLMQCDFHLKSQLKTYHSTGSVQGGKGKEPQAPGMSFSVNSSCLISAGEKPWFPYHETLMFLGMSPKLSVTLCLHLRPMWSTLVICTATVACSKHFVDDSCH